MRRIQCTYIGTSRASLCPDSWPIDFLLLLVTNNMVGTYYACWLLLAAVAYTLYLDVYVYVWQQSVTHTHTHYCRYIKCATSEWECNVAARTIHSKLCGPKRRGMHNECFCFTFFHHRILSIIMGTICTSFPMSFYINSWFFFYFHSCHLYNKITSLRILPRNKEKKNNTKISPLITCISNVDLHTHCFWYDQNGVGSMHKHTPIPGFEWQLICPFHSVFKNAQFSIVQCTFNTSVQCDNKTKKTKMNVLEVRTRVSMVAHSTEH